MGLESIKNLPFLRGLFSKKEPLSHDLLHKWSQCVLTKDKDGNAREYLCEIRSDVTSAKIYGILVPLNIPLGFGKVKIPVSDSFDVSPIITHRNSRIVKGNNLQLFGFPLSGRTDKFVINSENEIRGNKLKSFIISCDTIVSQQAGNFNVLNLVNSAEELMLKFNQDFKGFGISISPLRPMDVGI